MSRHLPDAFVARMQATIPAAATVLAAFADEASPVSVRRVPGRSYPLPPATGRVAWCADGIYLPDRPFFAGDAAWHAGGYYVQEASSMSMTQAVGAAVAAIGGERRDLRVLDACAAPGGKSLAALAALPAGSLLVANEQDAARCGALLENIGRFGNADVAVTRADARAFGAAGEVFDIIIADMPCSGEGMMRKEEMAVTQWSEGLTHRCADLQRDIAAALWRALRPGGVLIYSTCTFAPCEDEDNVNFIISELGGAPLKLGLDSYEGVVRLGSLPAYRFMPGLVRGEGFFIAAVRKEGDDTASGYPRPRRLPKVNSDGAVLAAQLFPSLTDSHIATGADAVELVPRHHAEFVGTLAATKGVLMLRGGLPLASPRGRDLAPAHAAALATALDISATNPIDADAATAAAYLRGEALADIDAPKGYVLVCHNGMPLGWAKNIGRRANNLYPERSRVKKTI